MLPDIEQVLQTLKKEYRLVMATKGDLKEQEDKLGRSGLESYFHHIEIVSEKTAVEYVKLIKHLDVDPAHFLMIGNSLRSDVLPIINIGGKAIHVPFHTTWQHEEVSPQEESDEYDVVKNITEVLNYL